MTDRQTDRQTDGRAIAYSEREREFKFAKDWSRTTWSSHTVFKVFQVLKLLTNRVVTLWQLISHCRDFRLLCCCMTRLLWSRLINSMQLIVITSIKRQSWFTKVLRHTRHKIGHFGDVYGKTKPNTTKAHIHQSKQMYYNTKETQKTKANFSHLLWHPPENAEGLFLFRHFINLSLTYLLRNLPTYSQLRTHMGQSSLLSSRESRGKIIQINIQPTSNVHFHKN